MKIAVIGAGVSGLTLNQGGSSLSQKLQSRNLKKSLGLTLWVPTVFCMKSGSAG